MQTDKINFQDIWNKKTVEAPSIQEIKSIADKYRKKQLFGTLFLMLWLIATALGIILTWAIVENNKKAN